MKKINIVIIVMLVFLVSCGRKDVNTDVHKMNSFLSNNAVDIADYNVSYGSKFMSDKEIVDDISTNQPYSSYWFPSELKEWVPRLDEDAAFNRSTIKLQDRFVGDKVNQNADKDAKIVALSIMNPSTSNTFSEGSNQFDIYAFNYWQYIDILVSWGGSASEGLIVTPSADVINVAHKNGVKVLGTVFFPPNVYGGNYDFVTELLQQDNDGSFPIANKLLEVAEFYGFDGWFINQETEGATPQDAQKMQEFLKYIQKTKEEHIEIMWYDSMVIDGHINWQNKLTDKNSLFLQDHDEVVSNSMFLNFWWNERMLVDSHDLALRLGRSPYDLYAGIDVQSKGYNTPGIEWNAIFGQDGIPNTSLGIYCPDWTYTSSKSVQEFFQKANRFWIGPNGDPSNTASSSNWKGIANYVVEKSVINHYPFTTNFNTGNGEGYYIDGIKLSNQAWNNRSLQDILPTYRWIVESSGTALRPSIVWSDAYYGGSSLQVKGDLNKQNTTTLNLYKTNLYVEDNTNLSLMYKVPNEESHMLVKLTFSDQDVSYIKIGDASPNMWTEKVLSLTEYSGKTITNISLEFKSEESVPNYQILIGQLSLYNSNEETQANISNLEITEKGFKQAITSDVRLKWSRVVDTTQVLYEIYSINKDQSKTYIGSTYNNNYYIQELNREDGVLTTDIEVRAVDWMHHELSKSIISLNWPEYQAPKAAFTVSNTFVTPGSKINYFNDSTTNSERYEWEFEGGTPSTSNLANPTVTYNKEGIYSVKLKAINKYGEDEVYFKTLIIVSEYADSIQNVSTQKSVKASDYINENENPSLIVDDDVSTKWCDVSSGSKWLIIDLEDEYYINLFELVHAGQLESSDFNTRDYSIELSLDGNRYYEVINIKNNTDNITFHSIYLTKARYVKIKVNKPTQNSDTAVRIYEFKVYGLQAEN